MEAIHDSVVLVRDHCTASAAMMNEMSPRSMASRAQPAPEPSSSRVCGRVNGSRSSRSGRVTASPSALTRSPSFVVNEQVLERPVVRTRRASLRHDSRGATTTPGG